MRHVAGLLCGSFRCVFDAVCPAILKHTSVYLPWIKIIAQVVCLMRMKLIGVRVFHEQSEDFSG